MSLPDEAPPAVPEDVAAAAPAQVVLFDFDGVLMHGDAFYLFIRHRYAGLPWRGTLALLSLPFLLLALPFSRRVPGYLLVRIALLGLGERRYRAAASRFGIDLARRPRQFCREGVRRLRHHQARGDRVLVVTGCEHTLVSSILHELGLSGLEVLASQLRPGWLGMRLRWHNVGPRKVQSLAEYGVTAWQVTYGDSMGDVAMMKPAAEAVLVNATPTLCKRVEKALGRSVRRVEWD